ncbi:hypothetical protein DFQ26_002196 [Actinomortierella ambigua]|nr:hypothetical protein DFQ26_002196 [Actinomortierella ambigua]
MRTSTGRTPYQPVTQPSKAALLAKLQTSCQNILRVHIVQEIESLVSMNKFKNLDSRPSFVSQRKKQLMGKLSDYKGLPPHTLTPLITEYLGDQPIAKARNEIHKWLGSVNTLEEWNSTVTTHFDTMWGEVLQQVDSNDGNGSGEDDNDDNMEDEKENLRVCGATLKSIIHPVHLVHRNDGRTNYDEVLELIEDTQKSLNNVDTQLSILTQMATVLIASGEGLAGGKSTTVMMRDLLPNGSRLPPGAPQQVKVNDDLANQQTLIEDYRDKRSRDGQSLYALLSQGHLQRLHSAKLSSFNRLQSEDNPHFKALSFAIGAPNSLQKSEKGLSTTIITHIRQFSTAVNNLWSGPIYNKALDYLLRILLRLHLAPNREAKYREKLKSFAQDKAAKSKTHPRRRASINARFKSRTKQLSNELWKHLQKFDQGVGREYRVKLVFKKLMSLPTERTRARALAAAPNQPQSTGEGVPVVDGPELSLEESDALEEELEEEDDKIGGTTTEPSRKRLRALQAIAKTLLESKKFSSKVNADRVKKYTFKGDQLSEDEIRVLVKITNLLRPFVPKRWPKQDGSGDRAHTPHVVTRAPIVVIANAVLRATGYSKFARRLAPQVSDMSLHSLQLGASTLYEVLCSRGKGKFDAKDSSGALFASSAQAMVSEDNKNAMYKAFFNMDKVNRICKDHGLVFNNRMTFVDRHAVYMVGKVVQHNAQYADDANVDRRHGYPVESQYNKRRQRRRGATSAGYWVAEYRRIKQSRVYVDTQATQAAAAVKVKETTLKPLQKAVGVLQEKLTELRRATRKDASQIGAFMTTKRSLQDQRRRLLPEEAKLRELRQQSYYWNKVAQAAQSESTSSSSSSSSSSSGKKKQSGGDGSGKKTVATWTHPTVEDSTLRLDIKDLENQDNGSPQRHIVFAGTDYGIATMSETVALTRQEIDTHISRYRLLTQAQSGSSSSSAFVAQATSSTYATPAARRQAVQNLKLKKSHRMTAGHVNEASHTRKLIRDRERELRKTENAAVKAALGEISKPANSLSTADTVTKINQAHRARQAVQDTLQDFESSKRMLKMRRNQRLRTRRTWAKLCSAERRYVQQHRLDSLPQPSTATHISQTDGWCTRCKRHHIPSNLDGSLKFQHVKECPDVRQEVRPVLLIGESGTGVGSRIQGHARRGGGKMRAEHIRYCTIAMTDEFRTSKTCVFCFQQVRLARHRRKVKGNEKLVSVHGVVECINPDCPSVKSGYCQKPRDAHAAVAIALVGAHQLLYQKAFPPFSRAGTSTTNTRL